MKTKKLFFMIMAMLCTIFCVFSQQYKFGDEGPGGGIVFYYSEEGFKVNEADGSIKRCNYLEVSKMAVGCVKWSPCRCYITTDSELGFGKMNTYEITNGCRHASTISTSNCAAKACAEYSTAQTSKGEWFLPSENELYQLYRNLGRFGKISDKGDLWSSSQCNNSGESRIISFSYGHRWIADKSASLSVYAVRAF